MKQSFQSSQKQTPSFTPQQQQAVKILQFGATALAQHIQQELDNNPFLEQLDNFGPPKAAQPLDQAKLAVSTRTKTISPRDKVPNGETGMDIPKYTQNDNVTTSTQHCTSAASSRHEVTEAGKITATVNTLQAHLHQQAAHTPLSEREHLALTMLIDSTEDNGYLGVSLEEIISFVPAELNITLNDLKNALACLQDFEPVGVGCRNLTECLSIQLKNGDTRSPINKLAQTIVTNHLPLLGKSNHSLLCKKLATDTDSVHQAIKLVRSLDPHPGAQVQDNSTVYVGADLIVTHQADVWQVELNQENLPKIGLSTYTHAWLSQIKGSENKKPLLAQVQRAKTLLSHIQRCRQTTLRVATEIVNRQQAYFELGNVAIKPMSLKQIADALEMHISTVSRTVRGKYLLSNKGLTELRFFFSAPIPQTNGALSSSLSVRAKILDLIKQEQCRKPLSDNQITQYLNRSGLQLARRTVAKYREQLNIPASPFRKHLSNP